MAGGRKRKPTHLKVLEGTARPDRIRPDEPTPVSDLPVAPDYLSDAERAWFEWAVEKMDEIGTASATFTGTIALLAVRLAEIDELNEQIRVEGRTYETESAQGGRMVRAYPWVAQRNEAIRHAQSLMAECCLTPATLSKAGVSKRPTEGNPWERFKKKSG